MVNSTAPSTRYQVGVGVASSAEDRSIDGRRSHAVARPSTTVGPLAAGRASITVPDHGDHERAREVISKANT